MQPTDVTIEILKGIRDEVRNLRDDTNARFAETNARLDTTNGRLDAIRNDTNGRFERLERRHSETEVRLSTELVAVVGAVREVRDLLREDRELRSRVDDHEHRLVALEKQTG